MQKQQPISSHVPQFLAPNKILGQLGIEQNMTVVDLGCGSGYLTFEAAKLVGSSGKVYAIDVQKNVLSGIKSDIALFGARNVMPIWANLEIPGSTKLKDDSVDIALLVMILYQSKQHEKILEETKRILKPGGKLLIVDWEREGIPLGPELKYRISYDVVKQKAKNAGFKFMNDIETDSYHYGILFKK